MFESQRSFAQCLNGLKENQWHWVSEPNVQFAASYVLLSHHSETLMMSDELQYQIGKLTVLGIAKIKPVADLPFAVALKVNGTVDDIKQALAPFLANKSALAVNVFSQAPTVRQPGLLLMDMDSTAIQIECIDEIARLANVYDEVASVTEQAMQGALPFSDSLKQRVAKLEGVPLELIEQLKKALPLMPGVDKLCQHLKEKGWQLAIASGGFIPFAERVQHLLALDAIHANTLEDDGTQLTGRVLGTIVDAEEKARFLKSYAAQKQIPIAQTIAMGDGANDLIMMRESGLGVAVHGKPLVAKSADVAVNFGSLLQVLYFISLPEE